MKAESQDPPKVESMQLATSLALFESGVEDLNVDLDLQLDHQDVSGPRCDPLRKDTKECKQNTVTRKAITWVYQNL